MGDINFIVLKINGVDVSGMQQYDAVQMFLKSSEPITLEVRRPKANDLNKFNVSTAFIPPAGAASISSSSSFPSLKSTSNPLQQEVTLSSSQSSPAVKNMNKNTINKEAAYILLLDDNGINASNAQVIDPITRSPSGSIGRKSFTSTGIQTDSVITEYIFSDASIDEQSNENIFDDVLPPEIDIEEVTLQKTASDEKLGLTVSYSSGSDDTDTCTEVYISDIIPNSLAARDGRLRQGDQILQVNGRDVSNKEDTENLIAENKNAVTFLVSRYLYVDNDVNTSFDEYDNELMQQTYQNCMSPQSGKYHNNDPLIKAADIQCTSENTNSNTSISSSSHKSCTDSTEANTTIDLKSQLLKEQINHLNIDAHLESVNQELAQLTARVENSMMLHSSIANSLEKQEIITKSGQFAPDTTLGRQLSNSQYLYRSPLDVVMKPSNQSNTSTLPFRGDPAITKKCNTTSGCKPCSLPNTRQVESDTEHIYETIPEDFESEPFYCLPYESVERNLVEQWLEMQNYQEQLLQQRQQQQITLQTPTKTVILKGTKKEKSGLLLQQIKAIASGNKFQLPPNSMKTIRSNSSGEDHENSSSAYNTGGSCNSTTNVGVELNSNEDGGASNDRLGALRNNTSLSVPQVSQAGLQQQQQCLGHGADAYFQDINDNCEECQRQKKDKFQNSPLHEQQQKSPQKILNASQRPLTTKQQLFSNPAMSSTQQTVPATRYVDPTNEKQDVSSDTMYTNMANLKRTMLLQQKLFRQALFRQNVPQIQSPSLTMSNKITSPTDRLHFTAPNLSQYHFVSSQEVSSAAIPKSTHFEEPTMVWKVKRRQDGTRYIVRRPIRNRILRERAMRLTTERNEHTTEDDTISEIKTGRYWTREERKKHIERSKERRLKQQQQQQQMAIQSKVETIENASLATTPLCIATTLQTSMKKSQQGPPPGLPQQAQFGIVTTSSSSVANLIPSITSQNRVIVMASNTSVGSQNIETSINKRSMKKKKKEENTSSNVGDTNNKVVGLLSVTTV